MPLEPPLESLAGELRSPIRDRVLRRPAGSRGREIEETGGELCGGLSDAGQGGDDGAGEDVDDAADPQLARGGSLRVFI